MDEYGGLNGRETSLSDKSLKTGSIMRPRSSRGDQKPAKHVSEQKYIPPVLRQLLKEVLMTQNESTKWRRPGNRSSGGSQKVLRLAALDAILRKHL